MAAPLIPALPVLIGLLGAKGLRDKGRRDRLAESLRQEKILEQGVRDTALSSIRPGSADVGPQPPGLFDRDEKGNLLITPERQQVALSALEEVDPATFRTAFSSLSGPQTVSQQADEERAVADSARAVTENREFQETGDLRRRQLIAQVENAENQRADEERFGINTQAIHLQNLDIIDDLENGIKNVQDMRTLFASRGSERFPTDAAGVYSTLKLFGIRPLQAAFDAKALQKGEIDLFNQAFPDFDAWINLGSKGEGQMRELERQLFIELRKYERRTQGVQPSALQFGSPNRSEDEILGDPPTGEDQEIVESDIGSRVLNNLGQGTVPAGLFERKGTDTPGEGGLGDLIGDVINSFPVGR